MKLWATTCVGGLLLAVSGGAIAQVPGTASTIPGANTKAGVDAWMQGDFPKAVSIWRPLAAAGDADAQFNLGQAYKLGRGVNADAPTALTWFRKAADQGHVRAEDNYGLLLFQQNRREEALPYLRKSSARGDARAQYFLGTALYNGDGVEKDWVQAYALMTKSASSGLPAASASLATMDQYIPEAQRKQGLALAAKMDGSGSTTTIATASPQPPSNTYSGATPIRTTELPPSRPVTAPVQPPLPTRPAQIPPPVYRPDAPPVATPTRPLPTRPPVTPPPPPRPVVTAPPVSPPPAYHPPVTSVRPAVQQGGSWRVQLGVFSEEIRARNLWNSLSGKVPNLGSLQPYLVKQANLTRLQAGPLASAGAAEQLCRSVKAAGAECLVKPK